MTRSGRAALVAAAGFLLAAAPADTVSVTVVDRLSTGQQEETITVYFAGRLAGTVHIDANHPEDSFTATLPRAPHTSYTLCGRLLRREADGAISTHPIDNSGVLGDVAGQTLYANTLGDVLFALQPGEGGAAPAPGDIHPGPACDAVVAAR